MKSSTQKENLIGFSETALKGLFTGWNEKPYRVYQIFNWIYHKGVFDFEDMTNLSKALREKLNETFDIRFPRLTGKQQSRDGTTKFLFELEDGLNIESVWIPDSDRKTLCMSTQVGCRLGCTFCLTATMGLVRNLTTAEMIGQYMAINQALPEQDKITNIVIMGMGEPLDNYDALVEALRLMVSPEGIRISGRKITLSTSGLVDKIRAFQEEDLNVNLAISLNATEDSTRDRIMPINKKYPIKVLMDCLNEYPLKKRQRITFEYVLLKGVNDSLDDAKRLAGILKGFPCKVNLIPWNGFDSGDFTSPSVERVLSFQNYLISKNFTVFIRKTRGADISGACGQLATESLSTSQPPC